MGAETFWNFCPSCVCTSGDLLFNLLTTVPEAMRRSVACTADVEAVRMILSSERIFVCCVLRRLIFFGEIASGSFADLLIAKSSSDVSVSSLRFRFLSWSASIYVVRKWC